MAKPVRILLLGPPVVLAEGRPVELPRREVRALLYLLACQRAPISRDALIELFWPAMAEESARKRLREILARLKKALPVDDLLVVNAEQVGLDPEQFSADILDFQSAVDEVARTLAQLPPSVPLPQPTYQKISGAVQLWRSPAFLAGARLPGEVGLEDWARRVSQNLETSLLHMLQRLVDHDLATGNLDQAAAWLQTALAVDPLNETLHERKLSLYERHGWYADALAYLRQVRNQYTREGMPALPGNLAQIERRLREGMTLPRDDQPFFWPGQRASQIPLFGRQAELTGLRTSYLKGGVVMVCGETGSGKTRLVQELYRSIDPPPRLLAGQARPLQANLPYQPLIDMLRTQVTADEIRNLPKTWQGAISLLLPELAVAVPGLSPAPISTSLTPSLIYEALHRLFVQLSGARRLILFVDNAQWCDESTLDTLAYLFEHGFFDQHAVLILACRIEEVHPSLERFMEGLNEVRGLQMMHLAPLSPDDVARFAEFVIGKELPTPLVERLRQDTGGNPLFLLEALRALLELPLEFRGEDDLVQLPFSSNVHALVRQRVQRLSPEALQALTAAAVIGGEFGLELLEKVSNLSGEPLAAALEELERKHLILPAADRNPPGYRFIHDRVREIMRQELSPARRRVYHLRAADALKSGPSPADGGQPALLAYHYEEAGELYAAFTGWLKAARHAHRLFSISETVTAFKRAEKLLDALGLRVPDTDVFELYVTWGEFGFNFLRPDDVRHAAESLLQQGEIRQSNRLIEKGLIGLAVAADLRDDAEGGLRALDRALPYLEQHEEPVPWAQYHFGRGGFFILSNRFAEAVEELERSLRWMESSRIPAIVEGRAQVRYRLGLAYLLSGWPARAAQEAEVALEESRQVFSHAGAVRGAAVLAMAEGYLGLHQLARDHGEMALRMMTPMKNPRLSASVLAKLAEAELALGQLDSAWQHAEAALEQVGAGGSNRARGYALVTMAEIHSLLRSYDRALELLLRSQDDQAYTYVSADIEHRLGLAMLHCGREDEGLRRIERSVDFCHTTGLGLVELLALNSKAWGLLLLNRTEEANRLAFQVAARASQRKMAPLCAMAYLVLAEGLLANHQPGEARLKALAILHQAGNTIDPLLELRATHLVLRANRALGRPPGKSSERMSELIALFDRQTRLPALRPAFERFVESLQ